MIKILHLYPEINITCGVSKSIYSIVTNTSDVYENYVFCLGGDGIEKYKKANIRIEVFSIRRRGIIQSLRLIFVLLNFVKKYRIDILHSHHRYFDVLSFTISKIITIKTITSVHSKVMGKKGLSYKSHTLVACSNSIKKHLIAYFKVNPNRITVIHNFIDPNQMKITIDKFSLRRSLEVSDQSIIIGFVGRFSIKEKGIDILLNSFNQLTKEYTNINLVMIGEGEDKEYIFKFNASNGLNIKILPPQENIFDYYNMIDIVVLPSRVDPFPLVILESGLMKKPVIASNVDGLKEIIDDGINGFLVPAENIQALVQALEKLVENAKLREKFSHNLYQKVNKNFTAERIIPLFKQTYNQLHTNRA